MENNQTPVTLEYAQARMNAAIEDAVEEEKAKTTAEIALRQAERDLREADDRCTRAQRLFIAVGRGDTVIAADYDPAEMYRSLSPRVV